MLLLTSPDLPTLLETGKVLESCQETCGRLELQGGDEEDAGSQTETLTLESNVKWHNHEKQTGWSL